MISAAGSLAPVDGGVVATDVVRPRLKREGPAR